MAPAPNHLSPITRPLLADTVYERLLASVIRGDFAPGERLKVETFEGTLGVSRTPIREALLRLAEAQLVSINRNASTSVSIWGVADMRLRAQIIGGVARTGIIEAGRPLDRADLNGLSHGRTAFVEMCSAAATKVDSQLGAHLVSELSAPLRLFLGEDILLAHGIDSSFARFTAALPGILEELCGEDLAAAANAMDRAVAAFIEDLGTAQLPAGTPTA